MIVVKLISNAVRPSEWLRYFSGDELVYGRCLFTFERKDRRYDWLVVYDDLPPDEEGDKYNAFEPLVCPSTQTLLVTTEPSSIKCYGKAYTAQFGHVLTSQEPWALKHPGRIYSQPALRWFYGVGRQHIRTIDEMSAHLPTAKTRIISAASSSKRQRHTLHHQRYDFIRRLQAYVPELDVYGHGIRPMDDKAEALDPYYYHVAIENHIATHHWTEKLSDAFLGLTLPFYCGAPNAADYFPANSFIPIDIRDPAGAARIIREAIANNEYERRLEAIMEARHRVLYEYNLFAVVAREIERRHHPGRAQLKGGVIYSRHALRRRNLRIALQDLLGKSRARLLRLFHR